MYTYNNSKLYIYIYIYIYIYLYSIRLIVVSFNYCILCGPLLGMSDSN